MWKMIDSVVYKKKSRFKRNFQRYGVISLMALPGVLYLLINNYLPMFGVIVAFKNVNYAKGILNSPWVGLDNFKFLFKSTDAFIMTRNTILYNIAFISIGLVASVSMAILLNEIAHAKLYKVYQSTFIIPYMVSYTIVGYIVFALLSPDRGFVNSVLSTVFHKGAVNWYTEPKYWPFILVFVNTWKNFGYACVIYLASIISIDTSLFEAAKIDGANRWQNIRYITIPGIKPIIITLTLLSIGRIFYSDFGLFYQVTLNSGIISSTTSVIDIYVYRALMNTGEIGMASAAGLYQSSVGFVLILVANWVVRKVSNENALF